eukprot:TRINITY_DN541_c0_g1_i1.p1 TRINITY_DN541_c0_g1~~TRINITY_DN541_c0_g1_i1.p1  ORF type:complete len:219 (+),score=41.37 TRINITY_DN541_c0_g1_i1:66-722(+)
MKSILVALALVACVVAFPMPFIKNGRPNQSHKVSATPDIPVWPDAFSATIISQNLSDPFGGTLFFRWFWDNTVQKGRIDGGFPWKDVFVIRTIIWDHPKGVQYSLYAVNDQITCYTEDIPTSQYVPDFSNFTYVGESVIDYQTVYEWADQSTRNPGEYYLYFETKKQEPFRFETLDENGFQIESTFFEFDEGTQDPELFKIPDIIKRSCNAPPSKFDL